MTKFGFKNGQLGQYCGQYCSLQGWQFRTKMAKLAYMTPKLDWKWPNLVTQDLYLPIMYIIELKAVSHDQSWMPFLWMTFTKNRESIRFSGLYVISSVSISHDHILNGTHARMTVMTDGVKQFYATIMASFMSSGTELYWRFSLCNCTVASERNPYCRGQ